jgi:hypothetical protein
MRGLTAVSEVLGIAQYIPSIVNAMSNTSVVLFMGEGLLGVGLTPGRSICLSCALRDSLLWITADFSE